MNRNNIVSVFTNSRSEPDSNRSDLEHASQRLTELVSKRILVRHGRPALFVCFQQFSVPDSGERLTRKTIIGLGDVTPYESGVIYRHERTFYERKVTQLHFLCTVRANVDPILMLYSDPLCAADQILDDAGRGRPMADVFDEDGVRHILYEIADPLHVSKLQNLMTGKKLMIADGHHRYDAALDFKRTNSVIPEAQHTLMAFTNMYGSGLRTLATHRIVNGLVSFNSQAFLHSVAARFTVHRLHSLAELKKAMATASTNYMRIGVISADLIALLTHPRSKDGAVKVLHDRLLSEALGIGSAEAQGMIKYVRGIEVAVSSVRSGAAQIAFILQAMTIDEVLATALECSRLMPQKSTDFFPKMLSGLLIRKF